MSEDIRNPEVVLTADVSGYEQNIRAAETQTNSLLTSVTKLGEQLGRLTQQTGRNIQIVGAGTVAGLVGATAAAGNLESQLEKLQATSVMTDRSFNVSRNNVNALRGEYAMATGEVVSLVTQLNKLGQGGRPVADLAREFIKLGAVTGESVPALTQSMTMLQRQMGAEGLANTRKYTATLANLSEQAGVSALGITEFANAIAPASQMAGMGMKQVLGFSTAFQRAGADGYGAATAYQKMVNDINRAVQFGGPALQSYANLLGVSVQQMEKLPVDEAVTRVFETIAQEGPRSIKILEQLGFDGQRTYRSIAAVSQQGNIRSTQAVANESDPTKFAKAAEEAMSGLNDELGIFANNMTRTTQAIGSAFVPGLTKAIELINVLTRGLAGTTEALGAVPGASMAAGVAMPALAAGTLIRGAGALGLLGGARMVTHSAARAGWISGRTPQAHMRPEWVNLYNHDRRLGDAGPVGPFQRGTSAIGYRLGSMFRSSGEDAEGIVSRARAGLQRVGGGANTLGGQLIHGGSYLLRAPLKPLLPDQFDRISQRDQIKGGPNWLRQQRAEGLNEYRGHARAAQESARALRDLNKEKGRYSTTLRSTRTELVRFGGHLAGAGMGAGRWAAGGAAAGAGRVGNLALRGLTSTAGLLGGVAPMLALTGGIAAAGAYASSRAGDEQQRTSIEDTSGIAAYESAMGSATKATTTFADVLNQKSGEIQGRRPEELRGGRVSMADAEIATNAAYQYTNPEIANLREEDIEGFVSMIKTVGSDKEVAALAYDLLKRVGGSKEGVAQVNEWLRSDGPMVADRFSKTDVQGFWNEVLGTTGDKTRTQVEMVGSEARRILGAVPGEYQGQATLKLQEEALMGTRGVQDANMFGFRPVRQANIREIAQLWDSTSKDDIKALRKAFDAAEGLTGEDATNEEFMSKFYENMDYDTVVGKKMLAAQEEAGSQRPLSLERMAQLISDKPYSTWNFQEPIVKELQATDLGQAIMPTPATRIPGLPASDLPPSPWGGVEGQAAKQIHDAVNFAMEKPEDVWRTQQAAFTLATEGNTAMGTDYHGTQEALTRFRDAINDATDPLYQLATAAQQFNAEQMQRSELNLSTADQMASAVRTRDFMEERKNKNPNSVGAFEDYMAAEQRVWGMEDHLRSKSIGIIRGRRELDISMENSTADFEQSRGWQDADLAKNRGRATEDFNRSRLLQDQARNRQLDRTNRDFNISRERAEYEFNLGRTRQEESYGRQLARTHRDYNISRDRQQYEFDLGRQRQVESYGRQLTRTWRDFNISRDRAEYEFQLSRTRQEEDFQLQRSRAFEDFNRQRERTQFDFNLQRTRQEADFNHQMVLMAEQSARQIYNIYERVSVQRTLSGENVLRNMEDQARRMAEQEENLLKARQMGLSDAAIRMLGLNEAQGAQQLERLLTELDPNMIAQLNAGVTERTDQARDLMTDPANTQYAEMVRQYELGRERSAEDFQRSMDRSRDDFNRGMERMSEDYLRALERSTTDFDRMRQQQWEDFNRGLADQREEFDIQMRQSAEDFDRMRQQQQDDFNRSLADQQQEFDISMAQSAEDFSRMRSQQFDDFMRSLDDQQEEYDIQRAEQLYQFNKSMERQLDDYNEAADRAQKQFDKMQERAHDSFYRSHEEIHGDLNDLAIWAMESLEGTSKEQLEQMMASLDLAGIEIHNLSEDLREKLREVFRKLGINNVYLQGEGVVENNRLQQVFRAEGGTIPGVSPHKRADNIPVMATAGEFMQPVDSVEYYGVNTMEAIQKRRIPKEALQGYASGGLITDGLKLSNPGLLPSLISYGRILQDKGFQVGEHPLFGGVHPTAHAPTNRGGLHYIGHALDINYDGMGQAMENRMIDGIIKEVERRGFGYIWRSANHYDHLHIDTAQRRQLNGRTWLNGENRGGLVGSDIVKDKDSGFYYLKEIYDELGKDAHFKYFEEIADAFPLVRTKYKKRGIQKGAAIRGLHEMMKDMETGGDSNEPFNAPGGVERWRTTVERALRLVNQPTSLADITLRRMNQESSGNPRAINLWDSNAKNGTPSKGLMQVIDPTFRAYAMRGYNQDIWDPMSNILASMRYAMDRYGGLYRAYSRPGGYADGGLIGWHGEGAIFTGPRQIGVGERGPEMVLPLYGRGVEFLNELLNRNRAHDHRETFVRRDSVPEVSKQIVYNSSYDHSVHYDGQITIQSQDPDEMHRKLQQKRRQQALMGRRS